MAATNAAKGGEVAAAGVAKGDGWLRAMGGLGMPQSTSCCPRGHTLKQGKAKDARGKGRCDGCGEGVWLEDDIEFCVKLSELQESLDCNFYFREACVSSWGAAAGSGAENVAGGAASGAAQSQGGAAAGISTF